MLVRRVNNVLVNLVSDHKHVVFFGEIGNDFQLVIGKHLSAGVGGIAEDQRLGLLSESCFQLVWIKVEFGRIERNVYRFRPRQDRVRAVVLIKRREHDHLITRICNGHHSRHHRLGAAAGDDDLRVRVYPSAHEPRLFFGKRLTKILRAPCDGILVKILV